VTTTEINQNITCKNVAIQTIAPFPNALLGSYPNANTMGYGHGHGHGHLLH
jgi:hypothetical protein